MTSVLRLIPEKCNEKSLAKAIYLAVVRGEGGRERLGWANRQATTNAEYGQPCQDRK
jgi:hypothetical protein